MATLQRAGTWEISESEDENTGQKTLQSSRTGNVWTGGEEETERTAPAPPDTGDPPWKESPKRRKRRNKEETEAKARLKREAREKQRTGRAREKEEKRREQQRRREEAERLRSLRPESCLRLLSLCVDPAVLQHEGSDLLLDTLAASQWRFLIQSQVVPHSVSWTRDLPQPTEDGRSVVEEDQLVLVLDLADFIDVVICVKRMLRTDGDGGGAPLLTVLLDVLNRQAHKAVTLLVISAQMHPRSEVWRRQSLQDQMGMHSLDIEEVMVYLQLRSISVSFLEDWQDVTDHLCAVTKALSKQPYNRLLTERAGLPFCVDGSWASGARVERDGSGLGQVWKLQVQQLNRVSAPMASAVTAAFPSPQLLLQAYRSTGSEEERRRLLADLSVKGAEGKERRVGPDVSCRIYRSLTAHNPQLVLD